MKLIRSKTYPGISYRYDLVQFDSTVDYLNGETGSQTIELIYKEDELLGIGIRQSDRPMGMLELADDGSPDNLVFLPFSVLGDLGAMIYEALEVK